MKTPPPPTTLLTLTFCASLLGTTNAHAQSENHSSNTQRDTTYTNLKEATVSVSRLVFVTKKDTIVYDVDALKANEGDMLGDIINKMPGLEINDGVLYFKGRPVDRLMVNGIDFQRGDTKQALSVLPAYIIKKVKAYEGKTDESKITGLADGKTENVVDVILRKEYLGTWTGNFDLGGGTEERWLLRGFANTFTDRMRINVYGSGTNTAAFQNVGNDGSWSNNNAGGSSGKNTKFILPGMTFMYNNKKQYGEKGYFKVEGGVNWDYIGHNDLYAGETERTLSDQTMDFSIEKELRHNSDRTLGGRLFVEWQPDKNTYLQYSPNYTYRQYDDDTRNTQANWTRSYFETFLPALDSLEAPDYSGRFLDGAKLLTRNYSHTEQSSHSYRHYIWASRKLTAKNLRLALRNQLNYQTGDVKENKITSYKYYQSAGASSMDPLYNRYQPNGNSTFNQMTFLDLNIPLPIFQSLRFTYGYENSRSSNHSDGYRLERAGGVFADFDAYFAQIGTLPTLDQWETLTRDADITNHSTNIYNRHWFETSLSYSKGKIFGQLQLTGKARYDEIRYWKMGYEPLNPKRHSSEFLVNSQVKWEKSSGNYVSLGYYYETTPQSLNNEITIPDNSDPLNISLGNPDLNKKRYHSVSLNSSRSYDDGKRFTLNLSWNNTLNNVVSRRFFNKETNVTTTQPTTICGTWSANARTYGTIPLDKQKRASLFFSASYNYQHAPAYSLSVTNEAMRRSDSNQSVAFKMGMNGSWNTGNVYLSAQAVYSHSETEFIAKTKKDYWELHYILNGRQQLFWGIDFTTNIFIVNRLGFQNDMIKALRATWNVDFSKSFLKNKNLTVKLELSDILNQRGQYWGRTTAEMRDYGYAECLQRFFMAHLIYRFSTKKNK